LPGREPPFGIGPHDADAFDAADLGDIAPGALAEVDLGVIEPERLDLDDDVTGFWIGRRTLLDRQHFWAAILLDDDGTHDGPPDLPVKGYSCKIAGEI
jgi:hypothetical protein